MDGSNSRPDEMLTAVDGEREPLPPPSALGYDRPVVEAPAIGEAAGLDGLPPAPRRRRRWPVPVGAAGVLAVGAVGTVVVLTRDGGPSYPSAWDPRVADLVPFVEERKGATFEHPVRLVVLEEAEFDERVGTDDELSDEDREEIERAEATLRALGLHGGTGSLLDQVNTFRTKGVAGFYDPENAEIVVPASAIEDVAGRGTLVHELTHVLQDQLGQIGDRDDGDDSEAQIAFEALAEGEAEHVETAWIDQLSDADRHELEEAEAASADEGSDVLESLSPALVARFLAPYTLGESMVEALDDAGRLDEAFENPPNSSADVLDPTRWFDPVEPTDVDAPDLRGGEEAQGEDDVLGAHVLYLMLAGVIEPPAALDVVAGWGGDRMRFFSDDDGDHCLRASIIGVDSDATAQLGDALDAWVDTRPDGAASARQIDGHVELEACDRGTAPELLTTELANVPSLRADMVVAFMSSGADIDMATCVATGLLDLVPMEVLTADSLSAAQEEEFYESATEAATHCAGTS